MPPVMHLILLVSLFAVTVCTDNTTSSATQHMTEITTSSAKPTTLAMTIKYNVSSSIVTTTNDTQQLSTTTTTQKNTTAVSPEEVSLSPPLTFSQTPNRTEETDPSPPPGTETTIQTSNVTVSHETTLPSGSALPNSTATTTNNKTRPGQTSVTTQAAGLSSPWDQGDLANNPGLVAILCIFCIIVALLLVVVTLKCIRSPRSNFERLEDVPMGKVNEESPFARYSK